MTAPDALPRDIEFVAQDPDVLRSASHTVVIRCIAVI